MTYFWISNVIRIICDDDYFLLKPKCFRKIGPGPVISYVDPDPGGPGTSGPDQIRIRYFISGSGSGSRFDFCWQKNMYNFCTACQKYCICNMDYALVSANTSLESFIKNLLKNWKELNVTGNPRLTKYYQYKQNKRFSQWYSDDLTHPEVQELGILTYVLGTVLFPGSGIYWYLYTYCTVLCICTFIPSCTRYGILYIVQLKSYSTYVYVKHSQLINKWIGSRWQDCFKKRCKNSMKKLNRMIIILSEDTFARVSIFVTHQSQS